MIEKSIEALNSEMPRPALQVGDIVQTTYHDGTPRQRKYGYHKPCTVTAVYPAKGRCQSGWNVDVQWPDGETAIGLDSGWFNQPKAILKVEESTDRRTGLKTTKVKTAQAKAGQPAQFDLFNT